MAEDKKSSSRHKDETLQIPAKANRILNIVLIGMLLIVLRIWHLAVIQFDEKLDESRKPQRRNVVEAAKRGTIRDRFNIPLANNKMQYNVAILYSQIKHIPTTTWEIDAEGKRVKRFKRREYITALSQHLADELGMDAERIEDLIHAKASFYNQIPYVLKEDITEEQYYRLKMMERDWHGINAQRVPRRYYPLGKVASDIIGYMGAINRQEYETIIHEIKTLENHVDSTQKGGSDPLPDGFTSIEQVYRRLKDLHELAYTINDSIGKAGIEGRYENSLRGFRGKRSYYSDAHGNFLRELPGTRESLPGKRILLTISSELQKYAEELLITNEKIRQTRLSHLDKVKQTILADKDPWIKGGAIIAMDPTTGELLAMASHPRFDPNDFAATGNAEERQQKRVRIHKWLENETHIASIWNQQRPLEREAILGKQETLYTEEMTMTWSNYLEMVLSHDSPLKKTRLINGTINDALTIQTHLEQLLALKPGITPYQLLNFLYRDEEHQQQGKKATNAYTAELQEIYIDDRISNYKQVLDHYLKNIKSIYDQVLFVDMMRLIVSSDHFTDELAAAVGNQSLEKYKTNSAAMYTLHESIKKITKDLFHDIDFKAWRRANEKEYLKAIRLEEKNSRRYAKPYIDYLDAEENEQFKVFWESNRWHLLSTFLTGLPPESSDQQLIPLYIDHFKTLHKELASGAHQSSDWITSYNTLANTLKDFSPEIAIAYMQSMRDFSQLDRPLLGNYRHLRKNPDQSQQEKHLASAFYPRYGFGYGRSQAYRQAATQGSLFKLITAYEALVQRYHKLEAAGKDTSDLNPLKMIDFVYHKGKDLYVGYDADNLPLPRFYKGGRIPRSASPSLGPLDLVTAIGTSSNPYFAIIAGDILDSPNDLVKAAKLFSFGSRTGIDLPGEITGQVPNDVETNRTGLYSFSIGQHTLVTTPLQTAVMLSTLANGGKVLKPKIVQMLVGRDPHRGSTLNNNIRAFPYEDELARIGIDFPLFITDDSPDQKSLITKIPTETKREIFLPNAIKEMILKGMSHVVFRTHGESLKSLTRLYHHFPGAIKDYIDFKYQLLGKTSTAESIENIDLDAVVGTNLYTHVWFGGIVYDKNVMDNKKEHKFLFHNAAGDAELVVVVYLKYGGFGKEAAPLAAQVAKKWREIKANHHP